MSEGKKPAPSLVSLSNKSVTSLLTKSSSAFFAPLDQLVKVFPPAELGRSASTVGQSVIPEALFLNAMKRHSRDLIVSLEKFRKEAKISQNLSNKLEKIIDSFQSLNPNPMSFMGGLLDSEPKTSQISTIFKAEPNNPILWTSLIFNCVEEMEESLLSKPEPSAKPLIKKLHDLGVKGLEKVANLLEGDFSKLEEKSKGSERPRAGSDASGTIKNPKEGENNKKMMEISKLVVDKLAAEFVKKDVDFLKDQILSVQKACENFNKHYSAQQKEFLLNTNKEYPFSFQAKWNNPAAWASLALETSEKIRGEILAKKFSESSKEYNAGMQMAKNLYDTGQIALKNTSNLLGELSGSKEKADVLSFENASEDASSKQDQKRAPRTAAGDFLAITDHISKERAYLLSLVGDFLYLSKKGSLKEISQDKNQKDLQPLFEEYFKFSVGREEIPEHSKPFLQNQFAPVLKSLLIEGDSLANVVSKVTEVVFKLNGNEENLVKTMGAEGAKKIINQANAFSTFINKLCGSGKLNCNVHEKIIPKAIKEISEIPAEQRKNYGELMTLMYQMIKDGGSFLDNTKAKNKTLTSIVNAMKGSARVAVFESEVQTGKTSKLGSSSGVASGVSGFGLGFGSK